MTCRVSKLNIVEIVSLRIGMTIYTGWVTAATIVSTTILLKALGMKDPSHAFTETGMAVFIIYVALFIYILVSAYERNPLYGCVYIWVLNDIRSSNAAYPEI